METVHRCERQFSVAEVNERVVADLLNTLDDDDVVRRRPVGDDVSEETFQGVLGRRQHQVAHVQYLHLYADSPPVSAGDARLMPTTRRCCCCPVFLWPLYVTGGGHYIFAL